MALQITVPIVKPKGVDAIVERMQHHDISFSEKGVRTCKEIKAGQFAEFVEGYKAVVSRDIQSAKAEGGDASELETMLVEMDLWGFQSSEKKTSLTMASAERGNTMVIYVVAFREREDGVTDFLAVNYSKSLAVGTRERYADAGGGTKTLKAICSLGIWNLVNHVQDEHARGDEDELVRQLKQEQMAKYLLASAYRPALEKDGIILEIIDEGDA